MKRYFIFGLFLLLLNDLCAQSTIGKPLDLRLKWMNPSFNSLYAPESFSMARTFTSHLSVKPEIFLSAKLGKQRKNGFYQGLNFASDSNGQQSLYYRLNFMQKDCRPHSRDYRSLGLSFEMKSILTMEETRIFIPDLNFGYSKRKGRSTFGLSTTNLSNTIFQIPSRFTTLNFHYGVQTILNRKLSLFAMGLMGVNINHLSARFDVQLKGKLDRYSAGVFIESDNVIGVECMKTFRWSKSNYSRSFRFCAGSSLAFDYAKKTFQGTVLLIIPFFNFNTLAGH